MPKFYVKNTVSAQVSHKKLCISYPMDTRFFIRKWHSAAQKIKEVQYWNLETEEVYRCICMEKYFADCPLAVRLLLSVKIYHDF